MRTIVSLLHGKRVLGIKACDILADVQYAPSGSVMMLLTFMSMYKLYRLYHPLSFRITLTTVKFSVFCVWCGSLIMVPPSFLFQKSSAVYLNALGVCIPLKNNALYYLKAFFILISFHIILVANIGILFIVRLHSARGRFMKKAVLSVSLITLGFVLRYGQILVSWLQTALGMSPPAALILYAHASILVSIALNPLICSLTNRGFNRQFCNSRIVRWLRGRSEAKTSSVNPSTVISVLYNPKINKIICKDTIR